MNLENNVALITGGKRIGQAVARALASGGADVALSYRSSQREAEDSAAEVRALGRRAVTCRANVSSAAEVEELVATTVRELGRLDILVNMASIYRPVPFEDLTEAAWREDLDANLTSAFLCSRASVPHMRRAGGGRIINIADWLPASRRPRYHGFASYFVAKAGVIALTEALALELAGDLILVNAVAPGPIVAPPDLSDEESRQVADATPLGRWGGEIEIAKAVLALVDTEFITGETIRVDGGRHLR